MSYTYEYYIDPELGISHVEKHEISKEEIIDFFTNTKYNTHRRKDKSYESISKLSNGRYIKVVYRKFKKKHLFLITAYDIEDTELIEIINFKLENDI